MGIRVNIDDDVAQSESRDIDPVPTGKYLVTIDEAELKESKSEKNPGKPYVNLTFIIADGAFEGRKIFTNIMLFGKAYSAVWLGKALGFYDGKGDMDFPEPGELLGQQLVVKAIKVGETRDKEDPDKIYPPKNEVKGMWPASDWKGGSGNMQSGSASRSGGSILP